MATGRADAEQASDVLRPGKIAGHHASVKVEEYQQARVKEVSPATSNREMALLKHMFNMAEQWGQHQGKSPVRFVKFLPEDNLRPETLSEDQEEKLLLPSPP